MSAFRSKLLAVFLLTLLTAPSIGFSLTITELKQCAEGDVATIEGFRSARDLELKSGALVTDVLYSLDTHGQTQDAEIQKLIESKTCSELKTKLVLRNQKFLEKIKKGQGEEFSDNVTAFYLQDGKARDKAATSLRPVFEKAGFTSVAKTLNGSHGATVTATLIQIAMNEVNQGKPSFSVEPLLEASHMTAISATMTADELESRLFAAMKKDVTDKMKALIAR